MEIVTGPGPVINNNHPGFNKCIRKHVIQKYSSPIPDDKLKKIKILFLSQPKIEYTLHTYYICIE